jgi:gamma-glutamyltranspeptidase/glutathione hydrolase
MEFSKGGVLVGARIVRRSGGWRQCALSSRRTAGLVMVLVASAGLGGCQTIEEGPHGWLADVFGNPQAESGAAPAAAPEQQPETPTETNSATVRTTYLGSLVADDPQTVEAGRQMLLSRGTAADAAAAMGLTLTVTLPSRAGLDGGGICLVHQPGAATVDELDFIPPPLAGTQGQIPGLARGLAMLQSRDGVLRWQQAVGLAEKQALSGIAVTLPLFNDLNAIGMAGGLKLGDVLPQRSVAATLARLRVAGATDFHTGELAARLTEAGIPPGDLAHWLPSWTAALVQQVGDARVFVANGPGGALAQSAWMALASADPGAAFATARHVLGAIDPEGAAAVTGFAVSDARGQAVSCAIGMGHVFGTGKLIAGLDIYAAVPAQSTAIAPIAALSGTEVVALIGGGGGTAASVDAAAAAWLILAHGQPADGVVAEARGAADSTPVRAADRLNVVSCPNGLPRDPASCVPVADPRGGGYAATADRY